MPAFIITAAVTLGGTLWANHKRKKAAEEAQNLLNDQVDARNELIGQYESDISQLMQDYEDGTLPVHKVVPDKGKVGESAYDALETAKSDKAVESVISAGQDALAQASNVSDPRIKQAVMQKAHKDHVRNVEKAQADSVDKIMQAQMTVGQAETDVNKQFAAAKNQAESQYAQQVQSYMMNEQNRLNNLISQQGENVFDVEYQAGMVVPQAQAQNAADFASAAGQVAGVGYTEFAETGVKLPEKRDIDYLSRLQEILGESSAASNFASAVEKYKEAADGLRNGGITEGEFNHGDPSKPETGNDQVLLDQEELKKVMDSGGVNSFDELMSAVPPQVITTGGEGIKNEANFGDEEDLTDATDINNPMKVENIEFRDKDLAQKAFNDILMAKDGAKLFAKSGKKNGKKTQDDVKKAEMLLAAYNRHLLAQPQFQDA